MTCCKECAYPGAPGVCVRAGSCPCHDTEDDDPASRISRIAARYDCGNGEAEALTAQTLARLAQRRRHSGKRCDRCKETKRLSEFGRHSKEPDGLRRECRACVNTSQRQRDRARVNDNLG